MTKKINQTSTKANSKIHPKQSEINYINQENYHSNKKSKCSVTRCICIQLLVLLCCLVLAAIIIPIIVIILDTKVNPCQTTYTDSFTYLTTPTTQQCTQWKIFTTGLTCSSYSKMRIYGSNDPTGITITDSATVTAFAVALRYNTSLNTLYNGIIWRAGTSCWGGYELSSVIQCGCGQGYTIRPCTYTSYWGGINSVTCNAQSQTLSVTFE
ncbi:hypothetical protein I4U23_005349 [Adineta vaga]|nr:hypothetical protein I4U23_005349 [Adineta vaga]